MADIKKLEIYLPAHAHQALRIFAITEGKTASRVVVEALDAKYPSLQALNAQRDNSVFRSKRGS